MSGRMDEYGLDTGLVDRNGSPVHLGDVLEFDAAEWGVSPGSIFRLEFRDGELTCIGSIGDIAEWCTVIKKWNA